MKKNGKTKTLTKIQPSDRPTSENPTEHFLSAFVERLQAVYKDTAITRTVGVLSGILEKIPVTEENLNRIQAVSEHAAHLGKESATSTPHSIVPNRPTRVSKNRMQKCGSIISLLDELEEQIKNDRSLQILIQASLGFIRHDAATWDTIKQNSSPDRDGFLIFREYANKIRGMLLYLQIDYFHPLHGREKLIGVKRNDLRKVVKQIIKSGFAVYWPATFEFEIGELIASLIQISHDQESKLSVFGASKLVAIYFAIGLFEERKNNSSRKITVRGDFMTNEVNSNVYKFNQCYRAFTAMPKS